MSNWLGAGISNLRGTLEEFTKEVLAETTEELDDPQSEVKVLRSKVESCLSDLSAANQEVENLRSRNANLQESLDFADEQLRSLTERSRNQIAEKDAEIRKLQNQLHGVDSEFTFGSGELHLDTGSHLSESPPYSPGTDMTSHLMKDQIEQLKAELNHWKQMVNSNARSQGEVSKTEFEDMRNKYENELISLHESNKQELRELKLYYDKLLKQTNSEDPKEARPVDSWEGDWGEEEGNDKQQQNDQTCDPLEMLHEMQKVQCLVDESRMQTVDMIKAKESLENELVKQRESNKKLMAEIENNRNEDPGENVEEKGESDSKKIIKQLEDDIIELRENLETLDSENQIVLEKLISSKSELTHGNSMLTQELDELKTENSKFMKELEQMRAENHELTSAYNDLNDELLKEKEESGDIVTSNRDLNSRLESLKADLIEYEEKYERCKADNAKSMQQLESLTDDFERLRTTLDDAQSGSRSECVSLSEEVHRLQTNLKQSLQQRDILKNDVHKFEGLVNEVQDQMTQFQGINAKIKEENGELKAMVDSLLGYKELFGTTEKELDEIREQIKQFELSALKTEKGLREEMLEIEEENSVLKQKLREMPQQNKDQTKEEPTSSVDESEEICSELRLCVQQAESAQVDPEVKRLSDVIERYRELVGQDASRIVEGESVTCSARGWTKVTEDGHANSGSGSSGPGSSGPGSPDVGISKKLIDSGDSNGWEDMHAPATSTANNHNTVVISEDELERLKMQLNQALAAVTEKSEELEAVTKELPDKNEIIQQNEAVIEELTTELQILQAQLDEQIDRESTVRNNVGKLTSEIEAKDAIIRNLNVECERDSERLTELQQRFVELEKSNAQILQESSAEKESAHEIIDLKQECTDLRDNKQQLQTEIQNLKSVIENAQSKQVEVESDLAMQTETSVMLKESLEAVQESHNERIEMLNSQLESAKKETQKERDKIILIEEKLKSLNENSNEVTDIETQLQEEKLKSINIESEKQQLIVLVNQKHAENIKYHAELQRITQLLQEKETLLANAEHKTECAKLETSEQLVIIQNELQETQTSLREIEGKRKNEVRQIEELTQQIELKDRELIAAQSSSNVSSELQQNLTQMQMARDKTLKELQFERERATDLVEKLHKSDDSRGKIDKELARLKEHLIQVEENYTREAIANEERETELRHKLRNIEEHTITHSQLANDSHKNMQDKMSDLETQLGSLSSQRDQAILQLSDNQEKLEKSNRSLQSLQTVLQHFQQEKDSMVMEEVMRCKEERDKMQVELEIIRHELETEREDSTKLQSEFSDASAIRQALANKEMEVRTLFDDVTAKENDVASLRAQLSQANNVQGLKADKDVLKNLFLGYFSAPKDKKAEVAHLLGAVLDFSPEDFKKIEGTAQGWLAFVSRGGISSGGPANDDSVTAQFIKFLEQESKPTKQHVAPPLSLLENTSYTHSDNLPGSRSSTPAGNYLRQQMTQGQGSVMSSTNYDLPTFANYGESILRPPSTSSDILKEALNQ